MTVVDVPDWLLEQYAERGVIFEWTPEIRAALRVNLRCLIPDEQGSLNSKVFTSEEELVEAIRDMTPEQIMAVHEATWGFLSDVAIDIVPMMGHFDSLEKQPEQWALIAIEAYARESGIPLKYWS